MQFVECSCILFYYGNEGFMLQELKKYIRKSVNIWLTMTQALFILLNKPHTHARTHAHTYKLNISNNQNSCNESGTSARQSDLDWAYL